MTIKDLHIGQELKNKTSNTISIITNLTTNSVEVFNRKASKKGIDCTNWYSISENGKDKFNEKYYII